MNERPALIAAILGPLLWALALGLFVLSIVSLLGDISWRSLLVTHFRPALAVFSLLLATLTWSLRKTGLRCLLVICFAITAWPVATAWSQRASLETASGPQLRITTFNIYFENHNLEQLFADIRLADADVVFLSELMPHHQPLTQALGQYYPYQVFSGAHGGQGEALFSKYPLHDERRTVVTDSASLWSVTMTFAERDLLILAGHPLPALNDRLDTTHQAWFAALEKALAARPQGQPAVVLGDLNATPWSPRLAQVLEDGGLRWVGDGFGTWPADWPRWLSLPIDQILLSSHLALTKFAYGPSASSDHRMMIAEMQYLAGAEAK